MEKIVKRAPGFLGALLVLMLTMFSCKPTGDNVPSADLTTDFIGTFDANDGQFTVVIEKIDNKNISIWSPDFNLDPLSFWECSGGDCQIVLKLKSKSESEVYEDINPGVETRKATLSTRPGGLQIDRERTFSDPNEEIKHDVFQWKRQN